MPWCFRATYSLLAAGQAGVQVRDASFAAAAEVVCWPAIITCYHCCCSAPWLLQSEQIVERKSKVMQELADELCSEVRSLELSSEGGSADIGDLTSEDSNTVGGGTDDGDEFGAFASQRSLSGNAKAQQVNLRGHAWGCVRRGGVNRELSSQHTVSLHLARVALAERDDKHMSSPLDYDALFFLEFYSKGRPSF